GTSSVVFLAPNATAIDISGVLSASNSPQTLAPGRSVIVYSPGDITATPSTGNTLNVTGTTGGAVLLQAGVNVSYDANSHSYSFTGPSSTGGSIVMPGVSIQTNSNWVWIET